jgi:NAD(P)H-hydrate repair Nnr-like enzyme with NAD(P)H-hydrate dehydratase domain
VLLDAFALGALSAAPEVAASLAGRLVLTPNPAEAALLLGEEVHDPGEAMVTLAERFGAVVSGSGMIAEPSGRLRGITAGGPGLATSGSGDVLAGAIGGILARGTEIGDGACWATYLHARAGDAQAASRGPLGYLASELAAEVPGLMARLGRPSARW